MKRAVVVAFVAVAWPYAGCGGKSSTRADGKRGDTGGSGATGGSATGGTVGTSGGTGGTHGSTGGSAGTIAASGSGGTSLNMGANGGSGALVDGGVAAAGNETGLGGCTFNGATYADGQKFEDDCRACTCAQGFVACAGPSCGANDGGAPNAGGGGGISGSDLVDIYGNAGMGGEWGNPYGDCTPVPAGQVCLMNRGGDLHDPRRDPFVLEFRPPGCHSSSCTEAVVTLCAMQAVSDGDFVAESYFCLRDTTAPGQSCTEDCSGGSFTRCKASTSFGEVNSVTVDDRLTIHVGRRGPPDGGVCFDLP